MQQLFKHLPKTKNRLMVTKTYPFYNKAFFQKLTLTPHKLPPSNFIQHWTKFIFTLQIKFTTFIFVIFGMQTKVKLNFVINQVFKTKTNKGA